METEISNSPLIVFFPLAQSLYWVVFCKRFAAFLNVSIPFRRFSPLLLVTFSSLLRAVSSAS